MEASFAEIKNYIDYLSSLGLSVTVHFKLSAVQTIPQPVLSRVLEVNNHTNPYCIKIKGEALAKCLRCQKMVIGKGKHQSAFCGSCHAGVREYIVCFYLDGVSVGYVAASGYQGKRPAGERQILWESALQPTMPEELLCILLPPLARMMERFLQQPRPRVVGDYPEIYQYVSDHYREVTLDSLCRKFFRSRSYISNLFNRNSGMTLRSYCNLRKLEDARQLLLQTDMSVTQIAYEVGFCDTSYFISLFKKHFGHTPHHLRRNTK